MADRNAFVRILITCQPGYGHLHPLLPLARAARDAGHDVLIASSATMCPIVTSTGFDCVATGLDWLLAREREAFPEMATMPFGDEHFRLQLTRVFRDVTARAMAPDLLEVCRDWKPDVIVRDDQEHGALIAAELLGIPHAVAGVLWLYSPALQQLVSEALDALLADFGLADTPASERAYRYLTLASMPPGWAGSGERVPATTHLLRPEAFASELRPAEGMPGWLRGLPDQPLVHANLGTIVASHTNLSRAIVEAFHDLPVNLVFSTGPHHDPAASGSLPANVRVIDYLPPDIMQRCNAAIVHAGYGSAMAAMVSGRPMVLLPVAADQPRNARRCVDLGLGIALFEGEWEAERIRAAVLDVLSDQAILARSEAMRASIAALPGAQHGVALLARLVDGEVVPGESQFGQGEL